MKTTTAARKIGQMAALLEKEGICGFMDVMNALLSLTPQGSTPERDMILEGYRGATEDTEDLGVMTSG